jgi:hypothetical protein
VRSLLRIALVVAALATGAACVPASEPAPPAGALGFATEPSPATRGEPLVTADGWTVHVERLVLQVSVSAQPTNSSNGNDYYRHGGYGEYRFDASQSAQLYARALDVGPASGHVMLSSTYIDSSPSSHDDDDMANIGVDDATIARFRRTADVNQYPYQQYAAAPSMLLVVRAENGAKIVTMDLTLAISGYSSDNAQQVVGDVRENALTAAPTTVTVESLFTDERTGLLQFDAFANADTNRDGTIDGAELGQATIACQNCPAPGSPGYQEANLLLAMGTRAGRLFVVR